LGGEVVEPEREEAEHKENPQTRSKIKKVPNQKETKQSKKEGNSPGVFVFFVEALVTTGAGTCVVNNTGLPELPPTTLRIDPRADWLAEYVEGGYGTLLVSIGRDVFGQGLPAPLSVPL
jgi:hypothetical protein